MTHSPTQTFWTWQIKKKLPSGKTENCRYNATHGPVTEQHVREAPTVKEWLGNDIIEDVWHPEGTK